MSYGRARCGFLRTATASQIIHISMASSRLPRIKRCSLAV